MRGEHKPSRSAVEAGDCDVVAVCPGRELSYIEPSTFDAKGEYLVGGCSLKLIQAEAC